MTAVVTGQARRVITHLLTDQNFISVCDLLDEVKRSLRRTGNRRELYSSSTSFLDRWFDEVRSGSSTGRRLVARALGGAWIDREVFEDERGSLRLTNGEVVPRGLFYDLRGPYEVWPGQGDEPWFYDGLEAG